MRGGVMYRAASYIAQTPLPTIGLTWRLRHPQVAMRRLRLARSGVFEMPDFQGKPRVPPLHIRGRLRQRSEQRLAVGIDFVIHAHRFTGGLLGGGDAREPRLQSETVARGDVSDFLAGKRFAQGARQRVLLRELSRVGLVDDDDVRFLELLAV